MIEELTMIKIGKMNLFGIPWLSLCHSEALPYVTLRHSKSDTTSQLFS